jgi:hypothetical protein
MYGGGGGLHKFTTPKYVGNRRIINGSPPNSPVGERLT